VNRQRATLTSKGQITIPREIRRQLGLETGDAVEFITGQNGTTICRARREANPFEAYIGALPAFRSKREINAWVAALRDPK
jgi:AbrB family looped-hinge helix DNA binding protein